ncbi:MULTISPECIES: TetR family transcriptional regulator [unclassified Actinomadura]|uniref:TetR/AcrR family transcriptional regulator n=1 Tax=unclassified Actinomadura TaxID=2626254 RepID=UPI0011F09892|nr:TetR family transcriptional regulator [Actinomadura sp. K4S16]
MNKSGNGRGRRPGSPDTREAILAVARRRFLADGYGPVTMRSIAAEAGVDAALISYFFGSKKGLFGAVLGLVANPPEVLAGALPGDPATLPERVLRAMVAAWDDPERGAPLLMMVRAAVQDPELARLVRDILEREMINRIAERLGGPDATARAAAFGTQLAGLIFARYVLAVEPVASMGPDELIRYLAPGLRAAVHGPPRRPRMR